jgi:DNA helicase-2/ATP-dependent DNA helicase PcrA
MPVDFAAELNPEQLAAVQAPDGPVLIIAAAGTGKTRTLVYRVAWLVETGVRGDNILLLTFTNKAAQEMMQRARERVGADPLHGMWGGTFHHVANRILRYHAELAGFRKDFGILDSDDQKSLYKAVYDDLGLKADDHFPKPPVLLSLFSFAANKGLPAETLVAERFHDFRVDIERVLKVHAEYTRRKQALNVMDFDDLLLNAVRVLEENPGPREYYQHKFRYVMVDEYQDTNPVQAALVRLLSGGSGNLLVVGDDFQSIYGWRGADYRNILDFPNEHPGASVYRLVTNYRSLPGILEVANHCIAGNPEQFQKEIRAVRQGGPRPVLAKLSDGGHQARYVISGIRALRRAGCRYGDIAILYRAHFHAMEMQLELNREQIPHVVTSGVRFFEQAHIKDSLCLPRLALNPRDELAFQRMVCLLPGVGGKGAQNLWRKLGHRFDPLHSEDRKSLLATVPKRGKEAWEAVHHALEAADPDLFRSRPGELIHLFLESFYDEYAVENFDNYASRLEDLQGLMDYTAGFAGLADFLSELALQTNLDESIRREDEPADAVRLGTIHQAKGLEFPAVFVLWCVDGMFPSGRAMEDGDSGGESEERRLFYVAVTRAKDHLTLGVPTVRRQRDGGLVYYSPSRFISERPAECLREERGGYY